jgi:glycosyltransferase involved in cell wall biosynthesis
MTNRAKYAIFLPVRNGAAYLREALDSIVSQTQGDWLLVVLDNASSDGSAEIAASYADPRISVRRSPTRLSIWASWHRIWTILSNDEIDARYVTVIGHDDRFMPTFLESIDRLIDAYPKASLYQTPYDMIDEQGKHIRPSRPIPAVESSTEFLAARMWGLRDSVGTGYVFRPRDYVAVGGIPDTPQLLYADDLLISRLSKSTFKATSRDSQCLYRLHRGSASHQLTSDRIEGQVAAIEKYVRSVQEEFSGFMGSPTGKAALACFLAREIMLLRPLATRWLMTPMTRWRVHKLSAIYTDVAGNVDYRQWLGVNFVTRHLYAYSKQTMLAYILGRARILGSFNRTNSAET